MFIGTDKKALNVFFVALLLLVLSLLSMRISAAEVLRDEITYIFVPSAERAYAYGSKYFDAKHAGLYDIARAERFFKKAVEIDPTYPHLQHQLARIAFLKGDFVLALARIDMEINTNPTPPPSSYYVRGLIKGYMNDFEGAAKDYEIYLKEYSNNWAAINDYAWVLLKADRPLDALTAVDWGLMHWPDNPWLLNSKATAHFELGQLELAHETIKRASETVTTVTEADWLQAYPGNDPLIANESVRTFQKAVEENMHTISVALQKSQKDVR